MGRANIDLSWLASLLTKTPTATTSANTPDLDPGSVGKFLDENGQDVSQPYSSPSQWQRLVHPEESGAIDKMNNDYISKPIMANLENRTSLGIRAGNVGLLPLALAPNTPALSAAAAGYGSLDTSPSYINQQNRALLTAQHGLPGTQAATDLNIGKIENVASAGTLDRQPMEQSILNQDTVNRWHTVYGLTPDQIELAEKQVKSDLRFKPTEDSIKTQALKNQQQEQDTLVPAEQNLRLTQTGNAQNIASENTQLWPYTQRSMDNHAVADAATSKYIPLQEPRGASIDNGVVTPFQRNPLGASQYESMMSMMSDINGKGTQTITGPDGKKMTVKMPNTLHAPFDPLGNASLPPSGSPMLKASSNGPSVTPDTTGSMAPPINPSLSSTTLPETHAPSINVPLSTTSASTYNTGMAQAGEQYQKQHAVSESLNTLLSKYGGTTDMKTYLAKSAPLNYNPDPEKVLDFISTNAKHMSKDDLKSALSLLHQVQ